ncbi:SUF system Fe-S cluster assembly regulator [Gammaproteobacteria bacterium]|nr:SUF system Fe-S cluster assembly regulator [Gammaproteobacteria bacterium]
MVLYRKKIINITGLSTNMLRISKLTDYSTLILTYLGNIPNFEIVSAANIAKDCHLALPTVSKLLKILADSDLVIAFRGSIGGYKIAKSIENISIGDVILAIEGQMAITECCINSNCGLDSLCGVRNGWQKVNQIIIDTLHGIKLVDMFNQTSVGLLK